MLWSVTTLSDGNATQYLRQYNLKTGAQSMPQVALNNSEYEHATFFLYFFFGCHQRLHTYARAHTRTYVRTRAQRQPSFGCASMRTDMRACGIPWLPNCDQRQDMAFGINLLHAVNGKLFGVVRRYPTGMH